MSKIAVTTQNGSIAFDGINITHFLKGDVFDGKQAQRLVEIGFAEWQNGNDIAAKLEVAQRNYDDTEENLKNAYEKLESATGRSKTKAEKKVEAAKAKFNEAKAELESLLNA